MYPLLPTVTNGDVTLREITKKDAADIHTFASDFEVTKYLSWGPYKKVGQVKRKLIKFILKRHCDNRPTGYVIIYQNIVVGLIDFHSFNQNNCPYIGYSLHRNYQNKGIMTKVVAMMLEVGFKYFNFQEIFVSHMVSNVKSQRVIQKNNFRQVRVIKNGSYNRVTKNFEDVIEYCKKNELVGEK